MNAAELISMLDLSPLEGEGGWFRRTSIDEHSSAILFLLTTETVRGVGGKFAQRSVLHRLPGKEVWHYYAGAPVDLLQLGPADGVTESVLGGDLAAGEQPQIVVAGGRWQGASTRGPWSLVGTTMAPAYRDEDFEAGDRNELTMIWPDYADQITALT